MLTCNHYYECLDNILFNIDITIEIVYLSYWVHVYKQDVTSFYMYYVKSLSDVNLVQIVCTLIWLETFWIIYGGNSLDCLII